jgi:hypothetical protein
VSFVPFNDASRGTNTLTIILKGCIGRNICRSLFNGSRRNFCGIQH